MKVTSLQIISNFVKDVPTMSVNFPLIVFIVWEKTRVNNSVFSEVVSYCQQCSLIFRADIITFSLTYPPCPPSVEPSVEQYKLYTAFFFLLLLRVSKVQIFSAAPCSQNKYKILSTHTKDVEGNWTFVLIFFWSQRADSVCKIRKEWLSNKECGNSSE